MIFGPVCHCKPIITLWLRANLPLALQDKVSSSYTMCFWNIWDDALFVAALGPHSRSYQILKIKSRLPDPSSMIRPFRGLATTQSDSICIYDAPLSPIRVLSGNATGCDVDVSALAPVGSSFGGSERIIRHVQVHDQQAEVGPTATGLRAYSVQQASMRRKLLATLSRTSTILRTSAM